MKKFLLFLFGVIVGVVGTFGTLWFIAQSQSQEQNEGLRGLTIFDSPADCVTKSNLRVIQVQAPDKALAIKDGTYDTLVVLLVNKTGKTYYDDERITIPKGKCAKQVGVFQYETKNHDWKTVPAVDIDL